MGQEGFPFLSLSLWSEQGKCGHRKAGPLIDVCRGVPVCLVEVPARVGRQSRCIKKATFFFFLVLVPSLFSVIYLLNHTPAHTQKPTKHPNLFPICQSPNQTPRLLRQPSSLRLYSQRIFFTTTQPTQCLPSPSTPATSATWTARAQWSFCRSLPPLLVPLPSRKTPSLSPLPLLPLVAHPA
ncbi:hypothetical protein BJ166DRAFT_215427 [Pestalotiopsis sp. NC0098]|nr:hypothetical protein BJ166DRAFT_215427 [Pestalotiopsis sp. NC0098]